MKKPVQNRNVNITSPKVIMQPSTSRKVVNRYIILCCLHERQFFILMSRLYLIFINAFFTAQPSSKKNSRVKGLMETTRCNRQK